MHHAIYETQDGRYALRHSASEEVLRAPDPEMKLVEVFGAEEQANETLRRLESRVSEESRQ
jgi:hypothetical protein